MHHVCRTFASSFRYGGGPLLGAVLLLASMAPGAAHGQDTQVIDRIAAVVGDEIVLKSEVDQLVRRQTRQQSVSYSNRLWMEALRQLVDQRLLAEEARRDTTITVSDQQLSDQLDRRIEQYVQRAGSEERLEQAYGKSILEIKEQFREDLRGQILSQQLRRRRMQNIDITPSEVRQWFEEIPQDSLPQLPKTVRLSHIVRYPKPTEESRQQAKALIASVRDSVVDGGASLEAMARQFSAPDAAGTSSGGLTNVDLDDLVPEFAAVASRTPVGTVSQPFYNKSQNGFHILRIDAKDGSTVDLHHVLIKPDAPSGERAKEYLSAVRDTLLSDSDIPFERMARRHSEEDRTAQNGGRVTDPESDTRDLVLDALGPSWTQTIRSLKPGDISEPSRVELLNGDEAYHIVRLERRVPAHRASLETDYDRIRQLALRDKRSRKMQEWTDQLRESIYVDIRITESELTAMRRR
ncbi:peptidylprolyl isomerase [Salinibacter altiplanensis]|uniref:peptidylprolyl isomerase n=1 Tax=Salinibacter altiplanensis TaxID=1803181 RepID=UPI000C9F69B9|nr:peptidylprolyl isomerase [Salinibacter altiplanensis]